MLSLREEKKREVEDLVGCQVSGELPDNCVMVGTFTEMLNPGGRTVWAGGGGWEESDGLHFEHGTPKGRRLESAGYGGQERAQG